MVGYVSVSVGYVFPLDEREVPPGLPLCPSLRDPPSSPTFGVFSVFMVELFSWFGTSTRVVQTPGVLSNKGSQDEIYLRSSFTVYGYEESWSP